LLVFLLGKHSISDNHLFKKKNTIFDSDYNKVTSVKMRLHKTA